MQDIDKPEKFYTEKFYLGKEVDLASGSVGNAALTYDSNDLTTHAVCVGMTGSGKTGLGIVLLEEAALNGLPAIILDPKGDLGNLLLAFPALSPTDFLPWIDEGEALKKGLTPEQYAKNIATTWKEGLGKWGEDQSRIQKYKSAVDTSIYTPASRAGQPLSILNSFSAPPPEVITDTSGAFRDRILSTVSGLLGLLGIDADPLKSKEHILISTILEQAWKDNHNLDLPALIQQIQKPPFDKVGVFPLDTFYPPKERLNLSISLNNLLASPGFSSWMEGEPLDIQKLLYTADGKPRHSIISIAHLSDSERMFFVTILLNELHAWVRRQSGTSSLRALFYMDEIFGFFPPVSTPPSKIPMLTLLKQARAFGLGVILATQNPVDLDYKGLANCGTWFIGKLQTDRDKSRVLEGLQSTDSGVDGSSDMNKMLSFCGNRIFIMRNVHEPKPVLFQTRWTLSYLRGPLTLPQIEKLTSQRKRLPDAPLKTGTPLSSQQQKPMVPLGLLEYTLQPAPTTPVKAYRPQILGIAKLHFVDAKNKVDSWKELVLTAPLSEDGTHALWEMSQALSEGKQALSKNLPKEGSFEELPTGFLSAKNHQTFDKSFINFLYQNQTLDLFECSDLKLTSKEGESEEEFKKRLATAFFEKRDQEAQKIRALNASKTQTLREKIRKATEKLAKQRERSGQQKFDTLLSAGKTILGGLFGRRALSSRSISQAGTTLKKAGKIGNDVKNVSAAEEDLKAYEQQLADFEASLQSELAKLAAKFDVNQVSLEKISIKPRKSDIVAEPIAILWKAITT